MQPKSGTEPGGAGPPRLDGFLSQDRERGPHLPPFRDFAPDLLPLAGALSTAGFDQPGRPQSLSSTSPPAHLVFSLRKEGFDFAVAVSPLGQGQAGSAAAGTKARRLDLYGGPHSQPAETKRPAAGAAPPGRARIASSPAISSLRRAQTQAVCGV